MPCACTRRDPYEGDIGKPAAAQPQLTGDVALRTPCIGMRT